MMMSTSPGVGIGGRISPSDPSALNGSLFCPSKHSEVCLSSMLLS